MASKATAYFCNTQSLEFAQDFPASFNYPPIHPKPGAPKRVYLAGPFFSMSQNWLIEEAFAALKSQGFKVFSPLHHVGRGSAAEVYEKDIKGVDECDLVFACVDGLDSGTIFEVAFHRRPRLAGELNPAKFAVFAPKASEKVKAFAGAPGVFNCRGKRRRVVLLQKLGQESCGVHCSYLCGRCPNAQFAKADFAILSISGTPFLLRHFWLFANTGQGTATQFLTSYAVPTPRCRCEQRRQTTVPRLEE